MKNLLTLTVLCVFFYAQSVKAADVNPDEILKKALETYDGGKSFKADGQVVSKMDMGKKPVTKKFNMSDKQIAGALKSMGKEATDENIKKMRNMMKMAAEMTKKPEKTDLEKESLKEQILKEVENE